jgi:hypothetical protein
MTKFSLLIDGFWAPFGAYRAPIAPITVPAEDD